jgi:hypothetical protein
VLKCERSGDGGILFRLFSHMGWLMIGIKSVAS